MTPDVSVIIPAYNNAAYLGAAIQSALDQTHPGLEVVVVDDASPEDVRSVVERFRDSRVRYVAHQTNRGLSAARNTGIRASRAPVLAFLDGDDLFRPEKIASHLRVLGARPEIGCTYNARFELNHSATSIRDLWRPPCEVGLADLAAGFPFSPSDMVLRREWAERVGLFDESYVYVGEDLDINLRLALAGCRFAGIDRALNARRYHAGRRIDDIPWWVGHIMRAVAAAFSRPEVSAAERAGRAPAEASHYVLWAAIAFAQDETALGRDYCVAAIDRDPSLADGVRIADAMIAHSTVDHSVDHEPLLRRMAGQLPGDLAWTPAVLDRAVARGGWQRAIRAAVWGDPADARDQAARAVALGGRVDDAVLALAASRVLDYAAEFGGDVSADVLARVAALLRPHASRAQVRSLTAHYSVNRAFAEFRDRAYARVPGAVLRAVANRPGYLANRGVLSILARSLAGRAAAGRPGA